MEDFKKYIGGIKAEGELKESTKEYVLRQLEGGAAENIMTKKVKIIGGFNIRKIVSIAAAAVICLGLGTGAYAYYAKPVSYLSVDINPSVELGINAFGRVVKADSINEAGKRILEGAKVKNQLVKDAVSNLVKEASDKGYIASDGSTVVSVTSESDNKDTADKLKAEGEEGVSEAVKAKNILAVVYANSSDLAMRTEAKDLGISPGKFKLIKIMQALDPSLNAADYKDAKMTALILKADELMDAYKNGTLTTDQQIAFKNVDAAAEMVKNSNGKQNQGDDSEIKAQNKNQGTKTPEQEKEQNKDNGKGQSEGKGNSVGKGNLGKTDTTATISSPSPSLNPSQGKGNSENNGKGNKR